MSEILAPLVDRLRQYSHAELELIAADAAVAKTLPRKLACGDRTNPTVDTIEPLIRYFAEVDRGERPLPFVPTKAHQAASGQAQRAAQSEATNG